MKLILNLLIVVSFLILGCSRTVIHNENNNHKISFKKVRLELNTGEKLSGSNAVMDLLDMTLKLNVKNNSVHYSLIEITKLEYSNSNLERPFAFIGGLAGFAIPLLSSDGFKGKTNDEGTVVPNLTIPISILSGLLGITTGHHIGSKIFIKWEEYSLEEIKKSEIDYLSPSLIIWFQFPLRK